MRKVAGQKRVSNKQHENIQRPSIQKYRVFCYQRSEISDKTFISLYTRLVLKLFFYAVPTKNQTFDIVWYQFNYTCKVHS